MKNILFIAVFLMIISGCGSTVDRESAEHKSSEADSNNKTIYKQLKHKESWVNSINSKGFVTDTFQDSAENIYIFSYLSKSFYITKLDSNANEIWEKEYKTDYYVSGGFITLDSDKNIFIVGKVNNEDIYTMKISSNGVKIWFDIVSTGQFYLIGDIQTDSMGNLFIVGDINGGKSTLDDSFLLKYSSTGKKEWMKTITSKYFTNTRGIEIDKQDNIYVSGITGRDIFLAKYSTDGKKYSYNEFKTSDDERAVLMKIGLDGYIYIAGCISQKDRASKFFVKKLDKNVKEKYFTTFEFDSDSENIHALNSDIYGNIYLYGEYTKDSKSKLFLTQINHQGKLLYKKVYDGYAYGGNLEKGSELYINKSNSSMYISSSGLLKIKGDEKSLGSFVLKLIEE